MTKKGFLTAEEYRTIRQTLGFTQEEAKNFHRVQNVRTIKRWENGDSFVSDIACEKISALFERINKIVADAISHIADHPEAQIVLIIYPDGCREMVYGLGDLPLSIHNAMIQRVYSGARAAGYKVGLVTFNPQEYIAWCAANGLKDSQDTRSAWAASVYNDEQD